MKSLTLLSLIVLNVVLAGALLAKYGHDNTAVAQLGRPADYAMITGEINGNTNSVIYLVDTTNGQLGAMIFDPTRSRFDLLPPIDLGRVLDQALQGGAQPGGNNPRGGRAPGR